MVTDDEIAGGAVLVGGFLALKKIADLENQIRIKDQQINTLHGENRRKDFL